MVKKNLFVGFALNLATNYFDFLYSKRLNLEGL